MRKDPNKAGEYQTAIQFNLRKTFLNFAQKIQLYLTSENGLTCIDDKGVRKDAREPL